MTFNEINKLVKKSQTPIDNEELEILHSQNPEGIQPYFRFLYNLVKYIDAKLCVEIGVYTGLGSKHLAASSSLVIGIDIVYGIKGENIISIVDDSTSEETQAKMGKYVSEYGKIDILFQDSSHHYLPSIKEWEFYSPLMADDGVWICDDISPAFYRPVPVNNSPPPRHNLYHRLKPRPVPEQKIDLKDYDPAGCGMVQYFETRPMKNKKLYPDVLHKGNTMGVILF